MGRRGGDRAKEDEEGERGWGAAVLKSSARRATPSREGRRRSSGGGFEPGVYRLSCWKEDILWMTVYVWERYGGGGPVAVPRAVV